MSMTQLCKRKSYHLILKCYKYYPVKVIEPMVQINILIQISLNFLNFSRYISYNGKKQRPTDCKQNKF